MDNDWFLQSLYEVIKNNHRLSKDQEKVESLMSDLLEETLPQNRVGSFNAT